MRLKYVNQLLAAEISLDHGKPPITTYFSGFKGELNFHRGGIMVINSQSCKGLEFDTVFLADINRHPLNSTDHDPIKRRFYVMTTRAIERLILLKEKGVSCPVDSILTQDPEILERK